LAEEIWLEILAAKFGWKLFGWKCWLTKFAHVLMLEREW